LFLHPNFEGMKRNLLCLIIFSVLGTVQGTKPIFNSVIKNAIVSAGDSSWSLSPNHSGEKLKRQGELKSPLDKSLLLQLSGYSAFLNDPGIRQTAAFSPSVSGQFTLGNWGLGLDAGRLNAKTDGSIEDFYNKISPFGFAEYNKKSDKWKNTFFSIGPQYTLKFSLLRDKISKTEKGRLDITLALKAGLSKLSPPDMVVFDSAAKGVPLARYQAPDGYNGTKFNIKPGATFTWWIADNIGASLKMDFLVQTGGDEITTGYRDLSTVNFGTDPREIRYQVLKTQFTENTTSHTKGPSNFLNAGAGITYRLPFRKKDKPITEVRKDQEPEREYTRPFILTPSDGASVSDADSQNRVLISWLAVSPLPVEPVVYNVKIFKNENSAGKAQPITFSKPVFEKEITNRTSLIWTPDEKPAGGKYTVIVRATNQIGNPFGSNNGVSDPANFVSGQNDIDITIDSLEVGCCKDGKQPITIVVKNNLSNTNTILKKLTIMALNGNFGTPCPIDISSSVSPALPFSFLPSSTSISNGKASFLASIDCLNGVSNLIVKAEAERNTSLGMVSDNDLEADTLHCVCKACDKLKIEIGNPQHNLSQPLISSIFPIQVSPAKVTKVTATLVYFGFDPESDECAPCNKDSKNNGIILSATLAASGFASAGQTKGSNHVVWNSNTPAGTLLNGQFNFDIAIPPVVKCCAATFSYCIRFSFLFDDCTTCEKVICTRVIKEGCIK